MRNPLLVPELREMLADGSTDELREFCEVANPDMAAEFVGALSPSEQGELLEALEPEQRSRLFGAFDDETKLALLPVLTTERGVELLGALAEDDRVNLLEGLSPEEQGRLRQALAGLDSAEAQPILESLETALEPEPIAIPAELTAEEIAAEISHDLEILRFQAGRVERTTRLEKGCWVNIENPDLEHLQLIAQHFKIPLDFLTASLDIDETARVEVEDGATLFIVKVPYFDEKNVDVLYFTIPVGIIVTENFVLTVCARPDSVLRDCVENRVRNLAPGTRFILQIIMRATLRYLQYLKQLNNAASIIQKKLEQESRNQQLIKLFNIEKSLVFFTTSLKSNMFLLERMKRMRVLHLDEDSEDLLEDIVIECRQAIEMAGIYSDILSGMMDAFASVISNNLNIVMKLLTSLTIIMTIPVFVTGIFGMNVKLPLQDHPYAFLMVMALVALLTGAALAYFVRRRWLET